MTRTPAKTSTNAPGTGILGTGTQLIGSNPLIDNPLNPVYDVEQAGHALNYTGQQANKTANQLGGAFNSISDATNSIGHALGFLTNGKNWVRLLEVIAGAVLIVMGLHQLTGGGGTVVNVAKKAAVAAA